MARVYQVGQAGMAPKENLEFQGHEARMVAQEYQEHQGFLSRFFSCIVSLLLRK